MPFPKIPRGQWTLRLKPSWSDIYWFDFGHPVSGQPSFAYGHPALVVSVSPRILPGTAQIIPLTDGEHRRAGYDFHVPVTKAECPFLDKDSIVKVDQIYCVLTTELPDQYLMGQAPLPVMRRIYGPLFKVLGVDRFMSP